MWIIICTSTEMSSCRRFHILLEMTAMALAAAHCHYNSVFCDVLKAQSSPVIEVLHLGNRLFVGPVMKLCSFMMNEKYLTESSVLTYNIIVFDPFILFKYRNLSHLEKKWRIKKASGWYYSMICPPYYWINAIPSASKRTEQSELLTWFH